MRSAIHIKSHPIHPVLVMFPLAFFTGAFVFDLIAYLGEYFSLYALGYYLCIAGVFTAALAAIPGVIDYLRVVPPDSSGKKRATIHGMLNVTVVVIFVVVIMVRREGFETYLLGVEGVAVVLLHVAGWMGATLVHRNQISVDHRYASAGKWKEVWIKKDTLPLELAGSDELEENQAMLVHVWGKRIVLAKIEDGYAAFDDRCPHRGGPLSDGVVMGGQVHCPWHGSQYDIRTGGCLKGPSTTGINVYQVKVQNGKVLLLNLK